MSNTPAEPPMMRSGNWPLALSEVCDTHGLGKNSVTGVVRMEWLTGVVSRTSGRRGITGCECLDCTDGREMRGSSWTL